MASTNKTSNYELSQFLGTDKPAWLSDYNQDMNKIDAQMKVNADTATGADGKADANSTSIGTLANLTTDDKTSVVAAINEVDTNVTTAQNTANSASTAANTANTNIAKFNLTEKSTLSPSVNKGTIASDAALTQIQFASDTTSSIFKIYGRMNIENLLNQSGTLTITLGSTSLRPTTSYVINSGAIVYRHYSSGISDVVPRNLTVNTDGSIVITDTTTLASTVDFITITIPPCLYFNTDFGDQ